MAYGVVSNYGKNLLVYPIRVAPLTNANYRFFLCKEVTFGTRYGDLTHIISEHGVNITLVQFGSALHLVTADIYSMFKDTKRLPKGYIFRSSTR